MQDEDDRRWSRRNPVSWCVLAAAAVATAPLAAHAALPQDPRPVLARSDAQPKSLSERIREIENDGVRVGVCAIGGPGGGALYSSRANSLFLPASNEKILTGIAVLAALGEDYVFRTPVAVREGVLVLEAGGDPNWRTGGAHDPGRIFGTIAEQLASKGVTALRGVRFDERRFVGPVRPEGWPQDQLDRPYCAPTSGFAVDSNCFRVELRPDGAAGVAAVEQLAPAVPLRVNGRIELTDDARRGGVYALWMRNGELRLRGHLLRTAAPRTVEGVLGRPRLVLRRQLEDALADVGIALREDAPAVDVGLEPIRTPLQPALREMLQDSSNFHAEQFVRVLGLEVEGEGSLEAGQRVLRGVLRTLIELPPDSVQADGSGLSRANRVSPHTIASLLQGMLRAEKPRTLAFLQAMPQAGVDGTLEARFRDSPLRGRVRAKTGWIRGASALSGYVQLDGGELRVFSILMNYDPDRAGLNKRLKREQERIVEAIAEL